jgi:acyl carrier protein
VANQVFSELTAKVGVSSFDESLSDRLATLDPETALALLVAVVTEETGGILRLPAGDIDPARPLSQLGMDSLMAVELRLALENRLRIDLPLMSLAEGTSIASLATRLASGFAGGPGHADVTALAERHEGRDPFTEEARLPRPQQADREMRRVAADR